MPGTLDDLTEAWLSDALGLPIERVVVERFGEGVGFLGDLARLHLHYRDGHDGRAPSTMVAKLPTQDPGGLAVGRMLSAWARESRFFADLAPRCPARVPACYFNGADPGARRWALLLEDCGPGVPTDQVHGASLTRRAPPCSSSAASMPAGSTSPVPPIGFPASIAVRSPASRTWSSSPCPASWPATASACPARPSTGFAGSTRLAAWADGEAHHPLTVVHADYRLDNLIFAADGTMTILDWQTALVGQGAMDLTSFLATSLSVEHRRAWEKELVALYPAEVGASTAEVFERVRSHLLWWMALYANNLSQIEPGDDRGRSLFEQMVIGTYTAAVDHEVGELLATLP